MAETELGLDSLASPDAASGAARFAAGAGRGGSAVDPGVPAAEPGRRIRPMPDVAAFDFDGTLTERGSVFGFLSALCGRRRWSSARLALSPRLAHAALVGGTVADRTKEHLFERVLAGVDLERAEQVGAEFARRHLDRHLRPAVQEPSRLAPRPGRPGGHRLRLPRALRAAGRPSCWAPTG